MLDMSNLRWSSLRTPVPGGARLASRQLIPINLGLCSFPREKPKLPAASGAEWDWRCVWKRS